MLRALVAAALFAVLAAPAASAELVALADLRTGGLDATGMTVADAKLRALTYWSMEPTDEPDFTLALSAASLHIEVDHAQSMVPNAGAQVIPFPWTESADYSRSALVMTAARPFFKVEIFPLDGREFDWRHVGDCLSLRPPPGSTIESEKRAQSPRAAPVASIADTIHQRPCPGTGAVVGDFLMVLWEADIAVHHDGHVTTYRTGEWETQARAPDGTVLPYPVIQADQVYATVRGGTLSLHREPQAGGTLNASVVTGTTELHGHLSIAEARGTLFDAAGEAAAIARPIELEGDLHVQAAESRDGTFLVKLSGTPQTVTVDGSPFIVQSTTSGPLPPPGATAFAAALLLAVATAWLLLRRLHRSPIGFAHRAASILVMRRRPRLALLLTHLAVRRSGELHALRACILYSMGRWQEALASAERADRRLIHPDPVAANALLASLAAARGQEHGEAGSWFQKAVHFNPQHRRAMAHDRALQRSSRTTAFEAAFPKVMHAEQPLP